MVQKNIIKNQAGEKLQVFLLPLIVLLVIVGICIARLGGDAEPVFSGSADPTSLSDEGPKWNKRKFAFLIRILILHFFLLHNFREILLFQQDIRTSTQ